MSTIDQLVTEQVLSWSRSEFGDRRGKEVSGAWPVITISRQYGAGGRSLAVELGRRIGFKVWDKTLLTAIADEAGADERFLASLDERRRNMIDDIMVGTFMGSKHSNTHYFRSLLRVVHTIAAHGKSIIVGRGGNYIIKPRAALRVRLVCPMEKRVSFIMEHENMQRNDAQKLINTRDIERRDFVRHYFKKDPESALEYDLVINTGIFNIKQAAELVLVAYEIKMGKAIPLVRK